MNLRGGMNLRERMNLRGIPTKFGRFLMIMVVVANGGDGECIVVW
jgi:hypothetical protein